MGALVNAVSPLTCLLRGEVVDRLETERKSLNVDPEASGLAFVGLASDWKNLLFPSASDVVFADGYAQAVTFALLLARTEGIPLDTPPHQIGATLGGTHSLMGKAPITSDAELWRETVELGRTVVWLHTYGEAMADADVGRPAGDIRLPVGDPKRVLNEEAVTTMPNAIELSTAAGEVRAGTGRWGPVTQAVFDCDVGGRKVVKSWFDYRRRDPAGKRTSPLDSLHVDAWPAEWSRELTDLLTVLTRLVDLEPVQADLLDRVLAGPLVSKQSLAKDGTAWPKVKADRRARHSAATGSTDGTLDLE